VSACHSKGQLDRRSTIASYNVRDIVCVTVRFRVNVLENLQNSVPELFYYTYTVPCRCNSILLSVSQSVKTQSTFNFNSNISNSLSVSEDSFDDFWSRGLHGDSISAPSHTSPHSLNPSPPAPASIWIHPHPSLQISLSIDHSELLQNTD